MTRFKGSITCAVESKEGRSFEFAVSIMGTANEEQALVYNETIQVACSEGSQAHRAVNEE